MRRVLVTGALGQIGSELVPALAERYGPDNVVAADLRLPPAAPDWTFEQADCTDAEALDALVDRHGVDTVYHLAALLSAVAEARPQTAWEVNMGGLVAVLETARRHGCAVFFPSSIGAFGPSTPRDATPQVTVQRPTTIYGVTKVAGELLCDYYASHLGVDVRGLRLPGLVSSVAPPGGGTTDYAVEIFHAALAEGRYTCFLRPDSRLDMMFMPDALRAMSELMEADPARLRHRNAYNLAATAFTPSELAAAIAKRVEGFEIRYDVDPVRQAIADSWPRSVDDSAARKDWGWRPRYGLDEMCDAMIESLTAKQGGPSDAT